MKWKDKMQIAKTFDGNMIVYRRLANEDKSHERAKASHQDKPEDTIDKNSQKCDEQFKDSRSLDWHKKKLYSGNTEVCSNYLEKMKFMLK